MSELWSQITSWDNVVHSYNQTLKAQPKHNVQCIKFRKAETYNLKKLQKSIIEGTYSFSPHHLFEIFDPKHRIIHAPQYQDKIVHHMIYQVLRDVFEPKFISDSYSCIRGKGAQRAVRRIQHFMRSIENRYGEVWVYKLDVSKFFPSINHSILKSALQRTIKCPLTLALCYKVIDGSPKSVGLPLGSVTSQLFANVHINPLDHYMKRKMKAKWYVRYADDIFILSYSRDEVVKLGNACSDYLYDRLKLSCGKDKQYYHNASTRGVDGLGYKIFPDHLLLKSEAKKRAVRRIRSQLKCLDRGAISINEVNLSLASWMSFVSLSKHDNFINSLSKRFPQLSLTHVMQIIGESK